MRLFDIFRPVKTLTPEEVRRMVAKTDADKLVLIDVREPAEYERGHLPGAVLIPLSRLSERMKDLDPGKPIITY
jgi:rhodanese-related sulfurtransferase